MSISAQDLIFIESNGALVRASKGDFLFHEGDLCENFVLVVSGSIKVQKVSTQGRLVVLYHVNSDHLCILTTSCLIGNQKYTAEAVAETDIEAWVLSKKIFSQLMSESISFSSFVFASLSGRIQGLILKIDEIAFSDLGSRLAKVLWEKQINGEINLSHQEIADEVGTAREVVSRQLKEFERKGLISMGRKVIQIETVSFLDLFPNFL